MVYYKMSISKYSFIIVSPILDILLFSNSLNFCKRSIKSCVVRIVKIGFFDGIMILLNPAKVLAFVCALWYIKAKRCLYLSVPCQSGCCRCIGNRPKI